jgi:hypothetical protein
VKIWAKGEIDTIEAWLSDMAPQVDAYNVMIDEFIDSPPLTMWQPPLRQAGPLPDDPPCRTEWHPDPVNWEARPS